MFLNLALYSHALFPPIRKSILITMFQTLIISGKYKNGTKPHGYLIYLTKKLKKTRSIGKRVQTI